MTFDPTFKEKDIGSAVTSITTFKNDNTFGLVDPGGLLTYITTHDGPDLEWNQYDKRNPNEVIRAIRYYLTGKSFLPNSHDMEHYLYHFCHFIMTQEDKRWFDDKSTFNADKFLAFAKFDRFVANKSDEAKQGRIIENFKTLSSALKGYLTKSGYQAQCQAAITAMDEIVARVNAYGVDDKCFKNLNWSHFAPSSSSSSFDS